MDWARRHCPALHALLHGLDGAEPGSAAAQRRAQTQQRAIAVDRRYLRLPGRRLPDHHGHTWRPHRPPQTADARRNGVRQHIRSGSVFHQRGNADRCARAARHRRRHSGAFDPVPDPQHVPRPSTAHFRDCGLDHQLFRRCGNRTAGGWAAAGIFLVGFGVPDRRAGDGAAALARPGWI